MMRLGWMADLILMKNILAPILKAEKKIDFSFKFPGKELKTKSKCILKNKDMPEENLEI